MILKTFNNDIDKSIAKIGIFNKSLWAIQQDLKHGNGLAFSIFGGQSVTDKDRQAILKLNTQLQNGIRPSQAWATTMTNCSIAAQNQARQCLKANGSLIELANGLETTTISATAGQAALRGLSIAGNMLAMWGISVVIQTAITWIDKLVHSAEYAEKAIKAATDSAKSFSDTIKDIQKETVDMEKSVDFIIDKYAKLSQGVNAFTNENQSLPTEQYEEFLELNKQLSELFPSLTRNYDENGNAILGLSGSVDNVTESIKALVEQEKELAKAKIRENIEQYFDGTDEADGAWKALEGRKQKLEEANEALTTLNNTYKGLIYTDVSTVVGRYHKNFVGKEKEKYIEYINDNFGEEIAEAIENAISIHLGKGLNGQFADLVVDFSSLELSETQKEQIANSYDTFYSELLAKQKTAISEFDSQNSEFSNNAMFWLADLSFYKNSDKYMQTAIQNLVRSISWSNYNFEELDYDGVKRILQDSILTPFQVACDDPNTKESLNEALKSLLTMDTADMSVGDIDVQIDSYINTIATAIGEKNSAELKIRLGFDDIDTLTKKYENVINNASKKFSGQSYIVNGGSPLYDKTKAELEQFFKENSINTSEEIDYWIEVTKEATSAAEAIKMYNEAKLNSDDKNSISLSISKTIDQLNIRLKPAMDSLKSAWQDIFTDDEADLNSINILSACDSIKSKLDELNKIEGITVDYSSYEDFVRVLRDSESTTNDVKEAFNSLATSITQAALSGTEDFETMKAALEDLGVVNSELVAFDALISNTEALKEAGIDLASVTNERLLEFANESVAAENAAQAYEMLRFHKELCSLQEMNTSSEVANLRTLAKNAGYTGSIIQYLTELEQIYQELASGTTNPIVIGVKLARAAQLQTLIQNAAGKINYEPEVDFHGVKESASSAAQSFSDLLDKELAVFDKKMEAGYIDFKDYIRDRLALIEDYYSQGKIKSDEYYSYLENHYKQELSYRDKVIKAVTRRIDREIDSLEKQKDAIEENYQLQIDALENQKTLLEDVNKERQRQIDLQKALYELERAKNQRTKLVYSEGGMHYVADDAAIRDAENEAENARQEIQISEIEKSISELEQARDAETDAIDDMIDKLQEYKEAWNDITSAYEEEQEDLLAAQILGQEWEQDILDTRIDILNQFKDDYIAIQQAMVDAAYQAAQAMANAENATISDSSQGKTNGSYEVVDESNPTNSKDPKTFNTKQEADAYAKTMNHDKASANNMTDAQFNNSDIPGYYVKKKYHTGLQQGTVNTHSFDDDFKLVQKVGLGEKEVPAILKEGEAVATPAQISNIADGLRTADSIHSVQAERPYFAVEQERLAQCAALLGRSVDEMLFPMGIALHDMASHGMERMTDMDRLSSPLINAVNNNNNAQPVVNQYNTLNCPNVTNNSGVEYLQRELGHLSLLAMQEAMKRH